MKELEHGVEGMLADRVGPREEWDWSLALRSDPNPLISSLRLLASGLLASVPLI